MRCAMCGREITNPNANYCDYCGTSVREDVYREVQPEAKMTSAETPKADRVPTVYFFGVMCLPFFPLVGAFAYLGILLYWAFAPKITDSRKSFARATLIYTVAVMAVFFAAFGTMMNTITSIPGMQ